MSLGDWWQILGLYEIILVWPLALITVLAMLRSKTRRGRVIGVLLLVVWFSPHIHRLVGDVYFDYLCDHKAGEFIYRTVDNVEGILQMRPRDGSIDYFDRMAMGNLPEDPWGHTNVEARYPWSLIGKYEFVETPNLIATRPLMSSVMYHDSMKSDPSPGDKVARFYGYDGRDLYSFRKEFASHPKSRFGFTWSADRTAIDVFLNVYPGKILIKELDSDETLAVTKGYFRTRPYVLCPGRRDDFYVLRFMEKVLRPRVSLERMG